jgi:hypothetical protein
MGVPNAEFSDELYPQLVDFLGFSISKIQEFLQENERIESYICLPSKHYPLQYLLQKNIGKCWPLGASLQKPKQDRSIVKVCLWCGAGSMTEQIESNILKRMFENEGVDVTLFSSESTTKSEFINIYENSDFDIIWVMSHGEYDHWKPGEVSIAIGNNELVSLDECMKLSIPIVGARRLLFLNICDGATHNCTEGLERLGFAPALANKEQCVISNLWPVTAWSAATFGAIYCSYLSKDGNFFEAFEATLEIFVGGNSKVFERLNALGQSCQELKDRLDNQDNNFDLMAYSGSTVFIQ